MFTESVPLPVLSFVITMVIQALKKLVPLAPQLGVQFPGLLPFLPMLISVVSFVFGLLPSDVGLMGAAAIGTGSNFIYSAMNSGHNALKRRQSK